MRARIVSAIVGVTAGWIFAALPTFAVQSASAQQIALIAPVVVPFTDAPFNRIVDPTTHVNFDLGGGDRVAQGWLTPQAAWLVWDPHWQGNVRSCADLIGKRTASRDWSDGFEVLRMLDANGDGELTAHELDGLALWRDENGDGISEPGEVVPVEAHGIVAFSLRGVQVRPGLLIAPAGIRFEDGATRPLYEWMMSARRS